jgi:uncharacterized membrane-anchored protein
MSDPDALDEPGPQKSRVAGTWPAWTEVVLGWFKEHERPILIGTVLFQLLVLFGMMVPRSTTLLTGETILLRVVPVDPRDLLRGDYVILSYEISRVPPQGVEGLFGPGQFSTADFNDGRGQTVYVTLIPEPDGRHYRGGAVSINPPSPGVKFIRGTLRARSQIDFGIESYFVQEGKGKDYENALLNRRLSAEVALTPDGHAALRGLRIE